MRSDLALFECSQDKACQERLNERFDACFYDEFGLGIGAMLRRATFKNSYGARRPSTAAIQACIKN